MNLTTDRNQDVSIVRVNETRLMYPILSEFANTVTSFASRMPLRIHNSSVTSGAAP